MSLRKNFDSFTPQQKLRDAEEEYVQAVYRLRSAEEAYEQNVSDLKREMDFLFRKVGPWMPTASRPLTRKPLWPAPCCRWVTQKGLHWSSWWRFLPPP